jgi:hypothetical protein
MDTLKILQSKFKLPKTVTSQPPNHRHLRALHLSMWPLNRLWLKKTLLRQRLSRQSPHLKLRRFQRQRPNKLMMLFWRRNLSSHQSMRRWRLKIRKLSQRLKLKVKNRTRRSKRPIQLLMRMETMLRWTKLSRLRKSLLLRLTRMKKLKKLMPRLMNRQLRLRRMFQILMPRELRLRPKRVTSKRRQSRTIMLSKTLLTRQKRQKRLKEKISPIELRLTQPRSRTEKLPKTMNE